jgi:murein L,D-transpeptidase YcbB/YkuD
MGSPNKYYQRLAKALFYRTYGKEISEKSFTIPSIKDDTIKSRALAREALIEKKYISKDANDEEFETGLKQFQLDHALKDDAVLGKYTVELLGESEQHQIDRTILSLERWRWRSPFPQKYIWINIPEYTLRFFINDTLYTRHRVVVGKPENTTPQLTSSIRNIIALPFWTQPQSIASKEFLPAQKAKLCNQEPLQSLSRRC